MDALILGSGPAGLAIAQRLSQAGLSTHVVAPAPEAPWAQNFGGWVDELVGWEPAFAQVWSKVRVGFGNTERLLERTYVRLDNTELRRFFAGPYALQAGRVVHADPLAGQVELEDGSRLTADLVVDATGAGVGALPRGPGQAPGVQVAYGRLLEVEAHPFGECVTLMDFSDGHLAGGLQADTVSSFLYALPLSPTRVFLEETSLVGRPPVSLELLEARLERRLHHLGLSGRTLEVERCFIPMGAARPRPLGKMFAFGGAASMVHPATGYSLGQLAAALPRLDAAIPGPDEGRWARLSEAVWPTERARAHDLYRFGMEVLLRLRPADQRRFFEGFFQLPPEEAAGYLAGRLSIPGMAAAMTKVFGAVPFSVRAQIVRTSVGPARSLLWSPLLGV